MSGTDTNTVVKYGDVAVDMATLPTQSVLAMFRRGLAHYFGNEGASAVSSRKDAFAKDNNGAEPDSATVDAWKSEEIARRVEALNSGTVGANSRGPRGTAVDTIARRIAESEMKANLTKAGIKFPTGKETVALPGADGVVKNWTRAEIIDYRLAHPKHGDRIRKAAEKEHAALARNATAAAEGGNLLDL